MKPRLSNSKIHVKRKNCNDNGFNNLKFTIVDCLNNVDGLRDDEIDDLLKKEKFWMRTLVMQHHGLNSKNDMYNTKVQYVENFNYFFIMIFLEVFQTSYEKCVIVKSVFL